MGEWQKTIGEEGEAVVERLLNLCGWGNLVPNPPIKCTKPAVHNETTGSKERETHGIDYLYSSRSLLVNNQYEYILSSVKYKAGGYPSSPVSLFKKDMKELAFTMDCFNKSELKREIASREPGIHRDSVIGVLFWLHASDDDNAYDNLIERTKRINLMPEIKSGPIIVVDNVRAAFIYEVLHYVSTNDEYEEYEFHIPSTGYNNNPAESVTHSKVMPAMWLGSGILPFKVSMNGGRLGLVVVVNENFSSEGLQRLMGLSLELSRGWAGRVTIVFRKFSPLHNGKDVEKIKQRFHDDSFARTIRVSSYRSSFQGRDV